MKKGLLIVISGPSGAGKGTIYNAVTARCPELCKSISVTTRTPRAGEKEGVHYYFRTEAQFNDMVARGEFLETAEVYRHHYGTPQAPVYKMLEDGKDVFFEIDIAGAKQIKAKYPECVSIFIMPPSFAVLEQRLRGRGTEDEQSLRTRIGSARGELEQYGCFDYIVFNDEAEKATERVMAVIAAERCKIARNEQIIKNMLQE